MASLDGAVRWRNLMASLDDVARWRCSMALLDDVTQRRGHIVHGLMTDSELHTSVPNERYFISRSMALLDGAFDGAGTLFMNW